MITKGKKYLITGGTGVIGYSLCKRIISMGGYVIVLSRSESKLNKLKEKYNEIEIVVGDICDKQLVRDTIKKVDGVFHLAAFKHVGIAETQARECTKLQCGYTTKNI